MKSKVLNEIFEKTSDNSNINEMIKFIKQSGKYELLEEVLSDVKEEYFIKDSVHGISHNERVVILAMFIGLKEYLSDEELKVVLKAALYHDIGRKSAKGKAHGIESAKILRDNKEFLANDFSENEMKTLEFLCAIHSNPDDQLEEFASRYGIQNLDPARKMMRVLKDADALDRQRLGRFGKLDTSYLRTESGKSLVETSKALIEEYRTVAIRNGISFDSEVFDLNTFNIIEDDENIYIFRALNEENIKDLENAEIDSIRTKGQVIRDNGGETRYGKDSKVSLEEIYSNVRVAGSGKNNNCISFSTNPNVSLDYTSDRYIMYAIPKNGDSSIVNAGQYMLEEVNKRISERIVKSQFSESISDLLSQIDSADTVDKIKSIISEYIDTLNVKKGESKKRFINRGEKIVNKSSIVSRFDSKKYLSDEQDIEYQRTIAKLTLLELTGIQRSLIASQGDNSWLLSAIGSAFSSSEVIHYGDIPKGRIANVSKQNIKILSLISQIQTIEGINPESLKALKSKILEKINNGDKDYEAQNIERDLGLDSQVSVSDAFAYLKITENSSEVIPYNKGRLVLEYIRNYAKAKVETDRLLKSIKGDFENQDDVIQLLESVEKSVIIPNSSIISRVNDSGIKLSGTVNLDMNPDSDMKIFSEEEQRTLISLLNDLNITDLEQIAKGEFEHSKVKDLISKSIKGKVYEDGEKEYYIDFLVDSLDIKKIYNISNVRTEKKTYLKNKIREELKNVDIIKLYKAFEDAGIEQNKIPNYVLNLLLENGLGNINSFELLVEAENLNEIIKNNSNNLNEKITAYSLDRFLGIIDNDYEVPESLIHLREYQARAVDGIDDIYENHSFAGVVLPTGAGKSFVAMTQMLKNPKQNMVYFAPQDEILHQFQKHILKNILNKSIITENDIEFMQTLSDDEIREFLKDKVYNQDTDILQTVSRIKSSKNEEEKKELVNKILPRKTSSKDDVMDAIKLVFPHLDMYCYQSLNGKEFEKLLEKNIDLMICDELHRTGATTWKALLRDLINNAKEKNDDFKILGITATPIRDDDHVDMMRYMAQHYGDFSEEELESKAYLAEEMYLVDAMQNRYVVEPKIVSFNFTLKYTDEYQYVKEKLEEEKAKDPNSFITKELQDIKDKMDQIIGTDSPEDIMKCLPKIKEIITQNIPIKLKNGKFIVFLPTNSGQNNMSGEEYVQSQMEQINTLFKDVNPNVESGYLLSNRSDKSENQKAISDFEISDDDALRLLYAINMLNEGVHVENINGELMLRKIGDGSNILYLQQIGRVIISIDPKNPVADEDVPIIFDVYNNYLTRDLDRAANSTTSKSDLNNLQTVANWMRIHERMPDINSTNHEEARKAIILKKIKEKYEIYLTRVQNDNLSVSERKEIERILEIAREINLFEMEIPDRIIPPGEKELGRVHAFEVKGETKSFLELYKQSTKVIKKSKESKKEESLSEISLRLKKFMNIFLILSQYNIDLTDEGIKNSLLEFDAKKIENKEDREAYLKKIKDGTLVWDTGWTSNCSLKFFVEGCFSEKTKNTIYKELDLDEDELNEFKILEELHFAIDSFQSKKPSVKNLFGIYDIRDIRKCGILKPYRKGQQSSVNDNGFVSRNCPTIFRGINIYTGTKYDENGYDINDRDADGFGKYGESNKYGFHKNGIHKTTHTHLNENFFDVDGNYWEEDPEYPNDISKRRNTYKPINQYGFDRDGKYYEEDENGNLVYIGLQDRLGFLAFRDVNIHGFRRDKTNVHTGTILDENFFDFDGNYWEENPEYPNDISKRRNTYKPINQYGFDRDGKYYEEDENGNLVYIGLQDRLGFLAFRDINSYGFRRDRINVHTGTILDENFFDLEGFYWEEISDGKYHEVQEKDPSKRRKTNKKYNNHGFDRDKLHKDTKTELSPENFDYEGWFYKKGENGNMVKTISKYNDEGIDIDGWNVYGVDRNGVEHFAEPITPRGFNQKKMHVVTRTILDEYDFDINEVCYVQDLNGIWIKSDNAYGEDGFNSKGVNKRKFRKKDRINIETNTIVDKEGFDIDGIFWTKDENGELVCTDSKYGLDGYDIHGRDRHGFDRSHYFSDLKKCNRYFFDYLGHYQFPEQDGADETHNPDGFDIDGIHRETGSIVDPDGFNMEHEYCKQNDEGEWISTGSKYNDKGFDYQHKYHVLLEDGTREEKASGLYDEDGYDIKGFDKYGFNRNKMYVYEDGTESLVNPYGFARDGYIYVLNEESKQYEKTDRKYDDEGYDIDGLNEDEFDKKGLYRHTEKLNRYGFDYRHWYQGVKGRKKDKYGFDFYGWYTDKNGVKRKYDQHNFDRNGYLYVFNEKTKEMEKTKRTVNDEGFDRDGFFYEYDEVTKIYKKTEYKTNLDGITIDGFKRIGQERRPELIEKRRQEALEKERKEREERERLRKEREEEAQKRRAEAHKKALEEAVAKKLKQEEKEERKIESQKEKEELLPKFKEKFEENGICTSTGLKYDENFFRADQINVITGTMQDIRGFNCIGQCLRNEHLPYDKYGFKQDGTHHITGERFYNGYNCFGVDENGKYKTGSTPYEISNARRYLQLVFELKDPKQYKEFLVSYAQSNHLNTTKLVLQKLKQDIFIAGEMYPPFKEEVKSRVEETKKKIFRLTIQLTTVKRKDSSNKALISKLEKEIVALKSNIANITFDTGEK